MVRFIRSIWPLVQGCLTWVSLCSMDSSRQVRAKMAVLVQPRAPAFDAGLRQPDAVRTRLAAQSAKQGQFVSSVMGYGFQGQGQTRDKGFAPSTPCRSPGSPDRNLIGRFFLFQFLTDGCLGGQATATLRKKSCEPFAKLAQFSIRLLIRETP